MKAIRLGGVGLRVQSFVEFVRPLEALLRSYCEVSEAVCFSGIL